jgi:hypothetical protein
VENFSLFTEQDRRDISYAACIGATTLTGAAVGRFGGLPGLLAGTAAGLAFGLMTCKRIAPAIERKIFSENSRLSEAEALAALRAVREITGVKTKTDAMYLLGQARAAAARGDMRGAAQRVAPRRAASKLLSARA